MAMGENEIGWFSPDPRGIIPLETFHVPHGLKRTLKRALFEMRIDAAFGDVMRGCAARDETWIDANILESYEALHRLGFAHSVETWRGGKLVGGLYGVAIRGAFFGESMFSRETDASKVALVHLVERLRLRGFRLLDTQWTTPHLERFGAVAIPKRHYMQRLKQALAENASFDSPSPEPGG